MYSYEERMRAVALYVRLGRWLRATIRELGCPSRNALKGWYRVYERQQDLPTGSALRPPKFPEAQKQAALVHYASHGCCVVKWLGLSEQVLGFSKWISALFRPLPLRVVDCSLERKHPA